jgi:hypothetical protein
LMNLSVLNVHGLSAFPIFQMQKYVFQF